MGKRFAITHWLPMGLGGRIPPLLEADALARRFLLFLLGSADRVASFMRSPMTAIPLRDLLQAFKRGWKTLLFVHLAVAMIAGTMVAPLAAGVIQGAVAISGQAALSDTAIAAFVFSPVGAFAALVIGTLVLALELIGYAALLIPARSLLIDGNCHAVSVPPLLVPALPGVLRISLRFLVRLALWSLPFLGGIGAIYWSLLGTHDINFYLAEKPPVFLVAVGLAAVVVVFHLLAVAWLVSGWVHALPLAIFRRESPGIALRLSQENSKGSRRVIFRGLVAWGVLTPLASSLLNAPWSAAALWAARHLQDQLGWLVIVLGICFALSVITGWLVGGAGLSLLALQNMRLYLQSGLDSEPATARPTAAHLPIGLKTAIAGGLAVCAGTVFLSSRWLDRLHDELPAVVIAHRGASMEAPENTLAAVRAALAARADWVEIDVQESADGTVMVFHDSDFKRMGGPAKGLWELRDAELATIDIGSWKSPAFAAERTPRLADVLALCKDRAGVLIELKYYGREQRLEQRVVETVEAAGMADQVMVMSLSHAGVRKLRQLRPQWQVGLLSSVALGNVTKLDLDFLGLNARTTSRKLVREAGRRGLKVHVWTVNDPVDMATMLGRGVDGLITDNPALARRVVEERAEATLGEKLLFDLAAVLGKPPKTPPQ
jgi:glycerophosphoryl diester phosphodiesterase